MVKEINITIAVRYIYREGKVFQHFVFQGNKRDFRYLTDPRYLVHNKLREKMGRYFLSNVRGDIFISKREEADRFVFEYETGKKEKIESDLFKIVEFVSSSPGCDGCKYARLLDGRVYCKLKKEVFDKEKKNCKLFKQKELFVT